MNYDFWLDKIFFKDNKINKSTKTRFNKLKYKRFVNIKEYIDNRYDDSRSERETLYRIHYNINERPVCKVCGAPVKFSGRSVVFLSHCSNTCKKLDPEVYKKWKDSCGELGTNREKAKQTFLERYGCENAYQIPDVVERIKTINKEKFPVTVEKMRQTCLKKYGVTSYTKTAECKEKIKQTCLQKYGVENVFQSPIVRAKYNWENIVYSMSETKLHNCTYKTSKEEDKVYDILKEIYPDIIRGYSSDNYKWNCDFYVPSITTYIEYHGFYYHGGKPYEGTEEDLYKVKELQEKSKRLHKEWNVPDKKRIYPDTILYVWTDLDVRKRNHCKEHNLNYLEFYNIKEVEEYINERRTSE